MFVVNIKLDGNTVLAQTYKSKSSAKKRYDKAVSNYNTKGWTVELQKMSDDTNIFEIYGL